MAFISRQLSASSGFGGAACGEYFTYKNLNDTIAQITAVDYFASPVRSINIGDLIYVQASDGEILLKVTQLTPTFTTSIFYENTAIQPKYIYLNWAPEDITAGGGLLAGPPIPANGIIRELIITALEDKVFSAGKVDIQVSTKFGPGGSSVTINQASIPDNTPFGTSYILPALDSSVVSAGYAINTFLAFGTPGEGMKVGLSVKLELV